MIRFLLCLALASSLDAQVWHSDTGCRRADGTKVGIQCTTGSLPAGQPVAFEVANVYQGTPIMLFYGYASDTYTSTGYLLPFNMGYLFPTLAGCNMVTSGYGCVMDVAQGDPWTLQIWIPQGVTGSLNIQALVLDNSPLGWVLSSNVLEYFVH